MSDLKPESTAVTALYAFAVAAPKDGEGRGIHVSLTAQREDSKLNFFLRPYDARKLLKALQDGMELHDMLVAADALDASFAKLESQEP